MKRFLTNTGLCLVAGLFSCVSTASAAEILLTDGEADLTFFYQSSNSSWHRVFRAHDETVASGLDEPFLGFVAIVGHEPDEDFNFDTLTTEIVTNTSLAMGLNNFLFSSAEGSPIFEEGTADLGIRPSLREDLGAGPVNQFNSLNLTLDLANSTFNGNPLALSGQFVGLFSWNAFDDPVALIDSSTPLLTANFSNFNHFHRHWGFTSYGDYDLTFDLKGVGGLYGATAPRRVFRESCSARSL